MKLIVIQGCVLLLLSVVVCGWEANNHYSQQLRHHHHNHHHLSQTFGRRPVGGGRVRRWASAPEGGATEGGSDRPSSASVSESDSPPVAETLQNESDLPSRQPESWNPYPSVSHPKRRTVRPPVSDNHPVTEYPQSGNPPSVGPPSTLLLSGDSPSASLLLHGGPSSSQKISRRNPPKQNARGGPSTTRGSLKGSRPPEESGASPSTRPTVRESPSSTKRPKSETSPPSKKLSSENFFSVKQPVSEDKLNVSQARAVVSVTSQGKTGISATPGNQQELKNVLLLNRLERRASTASPKKRETPAPTKSSESAPSLESGKGKESHTASGSNWDTHRTGFLFKFRSPFSRRYPLRPIRPLPPPPPPLIRHPPFPVHGPPPHGPPPHPDPGPTHGPPPHPDPTHGPPSISDFGPPHDSDDLSAILGHEPPPDFHSLGFDFDFDPPDFFEASGFPYPEEEEDESYHLVLPYEEIDNFFEIHNDDFASSSPPHDDPPELFDAHPPNFPYKQPPPHPPNTPPHPYEGPPPPQFSVPVSLNLVTEDSIYRDDVPMKEVHNERDRIHPGLDPAGVKGLDPQLIFFIQDQSKQYINSGS